MQMDVYRTLREGLEMLIIDIKSTDRYFEANPAEAEFDLNADYRKKKLDKAIEALGWLQQQKNKD